MQQFLNATKFVTVLTLSLWLSLASGRTLAQSQSDTTTESEPPAQSSDSSSSAEPDYVPSEEISEDLSVSFPVDI